MRNDLQTRQDTRITVRWCMWDAQLYASSGPSPGDVCTHFKHSRRTHKCICDSLISEFESYNSFLCNTMHSKPIDMLMDAVLFCIIRSWQLLFMFLCRLALGLTFKITEKTTITDPERAIAYGW